MACVPAMATRNWRLGPSRKVDGDDDLLAAGIADVAGFVLHGRSLPLRSSTISAEIAQRGIDGTGAMKTNQPTLTPGGPFKAEKSPDHWLLARLAKTNPSPGGRHLTFRMIVALNIGPSGTVIEFAPGLGEAARMMYLVQPSSQDCRRRCSGLLQKTASDPALAQYLLLMVVHSGAEKGLPSDSEARWGGPAMNAG